VPSVVVILAERTPLCRIIFISRLPESHKPIEVATIKQQNSRKKSVKKTNIQKVKKKYEKYN